MKTKLQVGQKIWLKPYENRGGKTPPYEVSINKIGNKYFEIENYRGKFDVESLKQVVDFGGADQCYLTQQEILDEKEANILTKDIRNFLGSYGPNKLTLSQVRRIKEIIDEKNT